MSGNTNAIGLPINTSNPLATLNGGSGNSHTFTQGSVLFCGVAGVFTESNAQISFNTTTGFLNSTFTGPWLQSPYYYTAFGGV